MRRIYKLDQLTSDQISAGEVVDRPASAVKELIENSLDAQSDNIIIEIKDGGRTYIRVTDNGNGIHKDDARIAFERHATSKIKNIDDLQSISSLGFRGEALASIASVSQVELITRMEEDSFGIYLRLEGGILEEEKNIGCAYGTTIIVNNLFYNTPARAEFLKSNTSETAYIADMIAKYALAYPKIAFRFINNGQIMFNTLGDGNMLNNITRIYGKEISKNLYYLSSNNEDISINAYISKPSLTRRNKKLQVFFVNGRYVNDKTIAFAIEQAYQSLMMVRKYPICFVYIDIIPSLIDVNIHPTKAKIRFKDEKLVREFITNSIKEKLFQENLIPKISTSSPELQNYTGGMLGQGILPIETTDAELDSKTSLSENDERTLDNVKNETINICNGGEQQSILEARLRYYTNNHLSDIPENKNKAFSNDENKKRFYFPDIKILNQIFQTYLLGQYKDTLYLIDQHGAHERVLYDHFIEKYQNQTILSQNLLTPLLIELSFEEFELAKNNTDILNKLGFKVEEFGLNTFALRAVPVILGIPEAKEFFLEVLNAIGKNISKSDMAKKVDSIISMACKHAIKAKDKLEIEEIEQLMKQLSQSPNPFTCPHGRPIIISITKKELEKKFKRI